MDKYDLVLDITEHPEKYSDAQLKEILSDAETRNIYNLLCKTDSAVEAQQEMSDDDVNQEWDRFQRRASKSRFKFLWLTGRAASVAMFLLCSLVALAIGVAVKVTVFNRGEAPEKADVSVQQEVGKTVAVDTIMAVNDSIAVPIKPILFEDATLTEIMTSVEKAYSVKVDFHNDKLKDLHLYYSLDPSNTLAETIEELNTFEQINIRIYGTTLIID